MESLRHHGMQQISAKMERIMYILYMIFLNTISLSLYIYIRPLKIRFRSSSINVFLDIKWNPPGTRSDIDYDNDIDHKLPTYELGVRSL